MNYFDWYERTILRMQVEAYVADCNKRARRFSSKSHTANLSIFGSELQHEFRQVLAEQQRASSALGGRYLPTGTLHDWTALTRHQGVRNVSGVESPSVNLFQPDPGRGSPSELKRSWWARFMGWVGRRIA